MQSLKAVYVTVYLMRKKNKTDRKSPHNISQTLNGFDLQTCCKSSDLISLHPILRSSSSLRKPSSPRTMGLSRVLCTISLPDIRSHSKTGLRIHLSLALRNHPKCPPPLVLAMITYGLSTKAGIRRTTGSSRALRVNSGTRISGNT